MMQLTNVFYWLTILQILLSLIDALTSTIRTIQLIHQHKEEPKIQMEV